MNISDDMLYRHAAEARDIWLAACVPPAHKIPEHRFSTKFQRKMKRLIAEQRRSPRVNRVLYYTRKAVAAVLIVSAVSFASLMTVEAYREKFVEVVIHILNELTEYRFTSETPEENMRLPAVSFTYLPAGMKLAGQDLYDNYLYMRYESDDGSFFELTQTLVTASTSQNKILDTEDSVTEHFYIHGEQATANSKNGDHTLIWTNDNVVNDLFGNISLEELTAIALGIK